MPLSQIKTHIGIYLNQHQALQELSLDQEQHFQVPSTDKDWKLIGALVVQPAATRGASMMAFSAIHHIWGNPFNISKALVDRSEHEAV